MSLYVTQEMVDAVSKETGIGPVAVRDTLFAAERQLADAVLTDLDAQFRRAAVEAGLNTIFLHHFSQIINNYRKVVAGAEPPRAGDKDG